MTSLERSGTRPRHAHIDAWHTNSVVKGFGASSDMFVRFRCCSLRQSAHFATPTTGPTQSRSFGKHLFSIARASERE